MIEDNRMFESKVEFTDLNIRRKKYTSSDGCAGMIIRGNSFGIPITNSGFTLVEILVALVIFTVGITALASVSLTVISGNNFSRKYIEAAALAQDTLEEIRNEQANFDLGTDMALGGGDDTIPAILVNCAGNDAVTDEALLFASPDHAYTLVGGDEVKDNAAPVACPFALDIADPADLDSNGFRRTWTVKDDTPSAGMKTVTVVIGWNESGGRVRYFSVTTAVQGN